ncbi:MAG: thioredoxin family protein [Deltaproteobacteria bacterium]|nr:thioredoxin family protein [Deltaproteobacteria bacterium]
MSRKSKKVCSRQYAVGSCYSSYFLYSLLLTAFCLLHTVSYATDLPIRGIARGESKIKAGDNAPLVTPELEKAHKQGKVIALQLGYSSHCPWCDRMERYIREIMKNTNNFDNKAVFIMTQIEHAKMIAPPDEGVKLKEAFGVEGQPWLFIIDQTGTVRFIYKIFVGSDTFTRNIKELLGEATEGHEKSKEEELSEQEQKQLKKHREGGEHGKHE